MNILCYGDSNTYGYDPRTGLRYPEDVRWTGVLRQMLPEEDRLIEEGCNGRTAAFTPQDETWKDGRSYLRACLNSHKPLDLIILMLGSNDLKREFHARPEDIARGIREHLDIIGTFMPEKQGYCPDVLLISPPCIGSDIARSAFADRFDADAADRSGALARLYRAEADRFAKAGITPGASKPAGNASATNAGASEPAGNASAANAGASKPEAHTGTPETEGNASPADAVTLGAGDPSARARCLFLDAAALIKASPVDSLHLDPDAHRILAEAIFETITQEKRKK